MGFTREFNMDKITLIMLYIIVTAACNVLIVRNFERQKVDIWDSPLFILIVLAVYVLVIPGLIWATYIILNGTIDIVGKRVSAKKGD